MDTIGVPSPVIFRVEEPPPKTAQDRSWPNDTETSSPYIQWNNSRAKNRT